MISELNDDEILEFLMTSDFEGDYKPGEFRYLLNKWRYFYRILHSRSSNSSSSLQFEIKKLIKRPTIPTYAKANGHMYYILVKNNKRDKLIKYLQQKKINTVFHYIPLHSSPFGKLKATTKSTMHNTNMVSNTLLRLPMHLKLNKKIVKIISVQISNLAKNQK
jgi:dTDP-4-amino-4,6-dideoxygalactose transaminase